jgi:hypothetical protein
VALSPVFPAPTANSKFLRAVQNKQHCFDGLESGPQDHCRPSARLPGESGVAQRATGVAEGDNGWRWVETLIVVSLSPSPAPADTGKAATQLRKKPVRAPSGVGGAGQGVGVWLAALAGLLWSSNPNRGCFRPLQRAHPSTGETWGNSGGLHSSTSGEGRRSFQQSTPDCWLEGRVARPPTPIDGRETQSPALWCDTEHPRRRSGPPRASGRPSGVCCGLVHTQEVCRWWPLRKLVEARISILSRR